MIENPKAGQRVAAIPTYDIRHRMVIATVDAIDGRLLRLVDETRSRSWWVSKNKVHDSSSLRAEAQRLLDAADKLESEASNAD